MASRPRITKHLLVIDGDMSGSITSPASIIQDLTLVGYGLSWAGTAPVGAVSVEVSNDYLLDSAGGVAAAGTWSTVPLDYLGVSSNSIPISGSPGNGFIDIDVSSAYAMRLVYTRTSGTGLLQVVLTAKVA